MATPSSKQQHYEVYEAYNCRILRAETHSEKNEPFTVYVIRVESSESGTWVIERRFKEFVRIHDKLLQEFPGLKSDLPKLPPKKLVGKMKDQVIEERKTALGPYLNLLLIHIKPTQSEALKMFLERGRMELGSD